MPHMRSFSIALLAFAVAGCRCSPPEPQPVTLRVVNPTRDPIYVDFTQGRLGLTVQRSVGGQKYAFDDLACECRYCDNVCTFGCQCPDAGSPTVLRIEAGGKAERTWDGVVQVSGFTNCGEGSCLSQENAPLNEPFTLELCFGAQRPTGVLFGDGGVGEGELPKVSQTCTTRDFTVSDLVVEIGPARGAACTRDADCKGTNELCFDGACTSGCPPNDFPQLGSAWSLLVPSPDNMGFFERSARPKGSQLAGTGTITAVGFQGTTLQVTLSRPGPITGEVLTGRVQVQLPPGFGPPLQVGQPVKALVVDDGEDQPTRAVVLRHATTNELLFAADVAQGGRLLTPADLAPFTVGDGPAFVGCSQTGCGRFLVTAVTFGAGGATEEVLPGKTATVSTGGGSWRFLNVASGVYLETSCPVSDLRPYAFWKLADP